MSDAAAPRWLPIESNPEVMNKFLHNSGLPKAWAINDVFGLDESLLAMLPQPVLSMLLLFPINDKYEAFAKKLEADQAASTPVSGDLYYMKQTISNACGTVAMIHAVANNLDSISLGDGQLKAFLDATKASSPQERAELLEKDDQICAVHDDVAREGQTAAPALEESVDYHFIAFVGKGGKLYELDGRKAGPVCFGDVGDNFAGAAAKAIKQYMDNDPTNMKFTLLALTAAE